MGGAAGSTAIGVGGGMLGSLIQNLPHNIVIRAITQKQEADYNAAIAKRDAKLAKIKRLEFEHKERQIEEQGSFAIRQQRLQQEAILAESQAGGAASGIQLGSGSILDWEVSAEEVFAEDRRQLDYDIANRVYEARIGAWNAKLAQNEANALASDYKQQGKMAVYIGIHDIFTGGVRNIVESEGVGQSLGAVLSKVGSSRQQAGQDFSSFTSSAPEIGSGFGSGGGQGASGVDFNPQNTANYA